MLEKETQLNLEKNNKIIEEKDHGPENFEKNLEPEFDFSEFFESENLTAEEVKEWCSKVINDLDKKGLSLDKGVNIKIVNKKIFHQKYTKEAEIGQDIFVLAEEKGQSRLVQKGENWENQIIMPIDPSEGKKAIYDFQRDFSHEIGHIFLDTKTALGKEFYPYKAQIFAFREKAREFEKNFIDDFRTENQRLEIAALPKTIKEKSGTYQYFKMRDGLIHAYDELYHIKQIIKYLLDSKEYPRALTKEIQDSLRQRLNRKNQELEENHTLIEKEKQKLEKSKIQKRQIEGQPGSERILEILDNRIEYIQSMIEALPILNQNTEYKYEHSIDRFYFKIQELFTRKQEGEDIQSEAENLAKDVQEIDSVIERLISNIKEHISQLPGPEIMDKLTEKMKKTVVFQEGFCEFVASQWEPAIIRMTKERINKKRPKIEHKETQEKLSPYKQGLKMFNEKYKNLDEAIESIKDMSIDQVLESFPAHG